MHTPAPVEVFSFRVYEGHAEQPRFAAFKATRQQIAKLEGEVLESTAEDVPSKDVDAEGCYRRAATGWSDLEE